MYQKYKYLNIEFQNTNTNNTVNFNFKPILENQVTHRWIELVDMATQLYPIDQPGRFYDFNTLEEEQQKALSWIQRDIGIINNYKPNFIDRTLTSVYDQDTLNYLHHIFEVYHGLLDKQEGNDFWENAPHDVRLALADLNIDVHRCETAQHFQHKEKAPRIVTTWYGMPKTHHLFDEDYNLFTNVFTFGTIYLNYTEIGKTLEDLWKDGELGEHSYAHPEAFKPFDFFSADFHIKFFNSDPIYSAEKDDKKWECFDENIDFFSNLGYTKYDKRLASGLIPVAHIDTSQSNDSVLNCLKDHQYVSNVSIIKE